MYVHDTIVAPATAPGQGAVAIIRLSGPEAIRILKTLWRPARGTGIPEPRKLRVGHAIDPDGGAVLDRAMAVLMPGPRSFTGEDVAELHCHGGSYLVRRIVGAALAAGARMAEAGEFTRRAFLNGRIDLTEAEAIADIVAARGEAALKLALDQMAGVLGDRITNLRRKVVSIRAHLEAEIDFSDEDIDLPSRGEIASSIEELEKDVAMLHESFDRGRLMREGARATIVGKPNVGKSSILNMLLGMERAIVSAIPGTTRDVIEDSVQIGPWRLVLQDTAGMRETDDEVERIGVHRTLSSLEKADLLLAVFDSSRALDAEDRLVIEQCRERSGVALLNKQDLPAIIDESDLRAAGLGMPVLPFCATKAQGIEELGEMIPQLLDKIAEPHEAGVVISRERHHAAIARALKALYAARKSALSSMPPEIVAVDVALAAEALGEITGEVGTEDILDAVFKEFCIGK